MVYLLSIIVGIAIGIWGCIKVGALLWENERQAAEARAESAANQARYELLQEVVIQTNREKAKAFEMFFQVAEIATQNMRPPTQIYPKPLPSLGLSEANPQENAVYTPNLAPNPENREVGENKPKSNLALKTGVREWLIGKDAKLFEGKINVAVEIEGVKYTCDYSQEKGKTNKVSTLPLYLGKCLLNECNSNFLSKEQSSKFCCEQHKNQHNNSK